MASAALPFFFPSVKLHGDGGIRQPRHCLLLGARRILAVSLRAKPQVGGSERQRAIPRRDRLLV